MNHYNTLALVLGRLDYGEADRILTLLTPDHGKVSVLAKGVRKVKSKLAGGVELFTLNEVVIIPGRGEIQTLRSTRMKTNFSHVSADYGRLQIGYRMLKNINKLTEANVEAEYFEILLKALEALNDPDIQPAITQLWFDLNFLQLQGQQPNLQQDTTGQQLDAELLYVFRPDEGGLTKQSRGGLGGDHIKLARLSLQLSPQQLSRVGKSTQLANDWLKQLRIDYI